VEEGYNLRSFRVIDALPPTVVTSAYNQIRVYTVRGNIDVTGYFKVTSNMGTGIYYPREVIEIIALDTA
jgi:hypothetical protein